MSQQGRFGKYGDLKRKEKIRQNRLMKLGHAQRIVMAGRSETPGHRDSGGKKK